MSTSSNFVQIQHHTTNHALSTYKQAMITTKTVNFSMRCDRCFVPLNVVHLFRMVKTCNSGIIQKQKGERDQFLILLFDHQCLLLMVTCVNLCLMRVNNIWDFKISYNKLRFSNNKALLDVKLIFIYCPTRLYHPYDSSWYIYRIRIHYVGVLHLFHELQVLRSNKDELQSGFWM